MSEDTRYSELFNQLLEIDGSFLTVPVARDAFGKQLARADQRVVDELRIAREELHDNPDLNGRWIRWVLERVLDLEPDAVKEGPPIAHLSYLAAPYGVTLRPTLALFHPDDGGANPAMLVSEWNRDQDLHKKGGNDIWSASPVARTIELCQALKVPIGLVTNGRSWVLVHAPDREKSSTVTWDAELWLEERETLDLFIAALGAQRFFGVDPSGTLPKLLEQSSNNEEQVTTTLGRQVRRAVELLVSALSDAHRESGSELLADVEPETTYRAAVTVMMRLVFLLSAEERELLLLGDETYDAHYAISTMLDQLEDEPDLDVLFNRFDAWPRMLATFRLVHGGTQHDERLSLPAYGGHLFDPDRFPFLEGRISGTPLEHRVSDRSLLGGINNRVILEILRSLQRLSIEEFKETRRLSFRHLDVEQIGTVYEGLLDHTCMIVSETTLGTLAKRSKKGSIEPEIPLSELSDQLAQGRSALETYLSKTYKFNASQLKKLNTQPTEQERARLRSACGNDDDVLAAVEPFFGILRTDLRGLPEVFLENSYVVVDSRERSDTGAHYTPRSIAEELVRYAIEPLVYEPGPHNEADPTKWKLRPWRDIVDLKIVDPACGSGAMLVATNRYVSDRLVEAWREQNVQAGVGLTLLGAEGAPFQLPSDEEDWPLAAARLVASRCLYGVDINEMAVEMCKLSLWLVTLAKGKPFSFVDHAIRHGDSLLGITRLEELEHLTMGSDIADSRDWSGQVLPAIERANERRRDLMGIPSLDAHDLEEKDRLLHDAEQELSAVTAIADALTGAYLSTADRPAGERDTRILKLAAQVEDVLGDSQGSAVALTALRSQTEYWLDTGRPPLAPERTTLHWPLEFPEVFVDGRGKFDATVSNPPFLGGQKITGAYGTNYREHLIGQIASNERGSADLVAYFFLRAKQIATIAGYLATNTIGQGDTSEVGLTKLVDSKSTIFRANSSAAWPGTASVEVAQVWITDSLWRSGVVLDGASISMIDEMLYPGTASGWRKHVLRQNAAGSFIGSYVLGMGFTMTPDEAHQLIAIDARNGEVLFPYVGGEDLNQSPQLEAPRWIINFFDWPEDRARKYPDCFEIVEREVKPERLKKADRKAREQWWRFLRERNGLYRRLAEMDRTLAICRVSKSVAPVFVPTGQVLSETTVVFAFDDDFHFGVLSSGFHYRWACRYASTMRNDLRYTPSDVFDTFPAPTYSEEVDRAGSALDLFRSARMIDANEGLTDTYNRVHDPNDGTPEIVRLRELHVDLDLAVRDAYGWGDLELGHAFHPVRGQGIRYSFSPDAAVEVLFRLLELNRERYEQEVQDGLHGPAKKNSMSKKQKQTESLPL